MEEKAENSGVGELRLGVLGSQVAVHFDAGVTPGDRETLRRAWSRCLDTSPDIPLGPHLEWTAASDHPHHIPYRARVSTAAATTFVAGQTFADFASTLTSTVTLAGVAAGKGSLLMLHAAGLAVDGTGRTVALVGRSGMGKTTATRLLGTGFGYVTDETVALNESNRILPYPKPLSVIVAEYPAPKMQMGPDDLGLKATPVAPQLAAVVLLDRNQEATAPVITPLTLPEAIIELAPQVSSLAALRNPLQRLCATLDSAGGALRVSYREAEDLRAVLPQLMNRPPAPRAWKVVTAPGQESLPWRASSESGAIQRARVIDAVEVVLPERQGTELVALTDQGVVRLGGVAPAVWAALATPCDIEGIAQRILPTIGLPAGYQEKLLEILEQMRFRGLIARSPADQLSIKNEPKCAGASMPDKQSQW